MRYVSRAISCRDHAQQQVLGVAWGEVAFVTQQ
jgi:hypothetical protein